MPRGTEEKGRVLLHARPLLPGEHDALTTGALCVSDDGTDVTVQLAAGRSKTFEVDGAVLAPASSPADASPLSAEAASLVHSLFSGINGTLLCHGSAGSGKTHTLFGSTGLLDAVLDGVFERHENSRCILHVSVEELHMERFTDLLLHDANSASRPRWGRGERRPDTTLAQHGSPLRDSSSSREGGHRSPRSSSRIPGRLSLSTAQPLSPHSLRSLGHSLKLPLTHSEVCRMPHMASKAAARPPAFSAMQHGGSSSTPARESRIPVFSSSGVPSPPHSSSSPPVGGGSKIPHPQATSSSSTNGLGTPARVCRQLVPPRSPGHGPEQHTPTSHMLPSRPRHTAGEAAAGSSPAALLSSPAAAATPQSAAAQHARCYACVCQPVTSSAEAKSLIHTGLQRRLAATPAAPGCGSSSHSRAHVIVTLTLQQLQQQQVAGGGQSEDAAADSGTRLVGQLHLVDLASSENLRNGSSAHSQGAAVINQSLCHLNRVLEMLFRGERVPTYRNSKLTHRLQDSLGGRSRLLLVACISTAQSQLAETVETLRFGALVRAVSNVPAVNGTGQGTLVKRLREQLAAQQDVLQQQSSKVSELQQVVEQQAQQLQALQALLAARQQQLAPAQQEQQAGARSHKQHADEGRPPQPLAALETAVSPPHSKAASPAADSPHASLPASESDVDGEGASHVEQQAVQGLASAAGNGEGTLAAAATSAAAAAEPGMPPAAAAPQPATVAVQQQQQQHRPVSPAPTPAAVSAVAAALCATLAAGDAGSSRLRRSQPATPTTPGAAQGSAWEAAMQAAEQHSHIEAGQQEEEQEEGRAEESSEWGSPGLLSKFLAAGRDAFSPRASGYQAVPATHPCDPQDTFSLLEVLVDQMACTAAEVAHTAAEASSCGSSRRTTSGGGRLRGSSSNGGGAEELGTLRRRTSSKGGAAGLLQQQQQEEEEAGDGRQASPCVSSHSGAEAQAEDSWRSWKQAQADDEAAAQPESEPENPEAAAEQPDSSESALAAPGAKQVQVRQQRQPGAASVHEVEQQ